MAVEINFRTDNRITIIGGTGDGKTTLGLKMVAQIASTSGQKTVILNPGAEEKLYDYFGDAKPTINTKWPDVQHVTPFVTTNKRKYSSIFWPIVQRGNVLTYIDEMFLMGTGSQYSLGLQYLYQAGRRRNCGTVAITQRPRTIPVFVIQMSDHLFVGDVYGDDLVHLRKMTGQPWEDAIQQRKQYEFLYWSRHIKAPPQVVKF